MTRICSCSGHLDAEGWAGSIVGGGRKNLQRRRINQRPQRKATRNGTMIDQMVESTLLLLQPISFFWTLGAFSFTTFLPGSSSAK